jgi:DNA-directed RNA polymerase subunit RPC12/RpoP
MRDAAAPKVDVLACAKCGAPVALGDADLARCKNCGAHTPIPEAHRKLRDLRRKDAELRARADAIFDELDSPPSLFIGVLAQTFDLGMFAFLIVYGIPLMLAAIFGSMFIVGAVAAHFGATVDDVPFPIVVLVAAFLVMVMTFVPRALGVYANRRASARAALVTALAAKLPTVEGGLATCRACGAPLDIPSDVRVVHCVYCDAINAVRIRTKLLAQTSSICKHAQRGWTAADDRNHREFRGRFSAHFLHRAIGFGGARRRHRHAPFR